MALIYDNPDLAALTLTRLAAEEPEGPGALDGRMHDYLSDLEQRNGTVNLEQLAIALARIHFKALDDLPGLPGQTQLHWSTPPRWRHWKTCSFRRTRDVGLSNEVNARGPLV